jgi:hypothetical protein
MTKGIHQNGFTCASGTSQIDKEPSIPPRTGTHEEDSPVPRFFQLNRKMTQFMMMKKAAGTKQTADRIHLAVSTLLMPIILMIGHHHVMV